jgi:hypothetical protein
VQRALYERVYGPWLAGGATLGEAIRKSKIEALAGGAPPAVVEGWSLLGDPALPSPAR